MAAAPIWVPAMMSLIATDQSVRNADKQRGLQRRGMIAQEAAQNEAKQAALAQQVRDQQRLAQANQKQPEVDSLLAFEQQPSALSSSMLTGGGKKGGRSRPSLLGDA